MEYLVIASIAFIVGAIAGAVAFKAGYMWAKSQEEDN